MASETLYYIFVIFFLSVLAKGCLDLKHCTYFNDVIFKVDLRNLFDFQVFQLRKELIKYHIALSLSTRYDAALESAP